MTSPHDPCGKIYTILSEAWTDFLWFFEPVSIPQAFREHLVLVLGWTNGRRGYVSVAMDSPATPKYPVPHSNRPQITPHIPDGANPDHCIRIRSPRRGAVVPNETTVTLRKNKRFSVLVESSYVRLDRVWEVSVAILLEVPRTGMQLMLRAASMEKIMRFYSMWGWDRAWGRTYRSGSASLRRRGHGQDQNSLGPPESIKRDGEVEHIQMTRRLCHSLNGLASSGILRKDGEAEAEALAHSESTQRWDSAYRPDDEEHSRLDEWRSPCARQEMIYAGHAHCEALAKLLQDAQR